MKTTEKLLKLLKEKGLTQDAFEPMAGLPRGRITRWKDGTGEMSGRQAVQIAKLLCVPLDYLLDDEIQEIATDNTPADEVAVLALYRSLKAQGLPLQKALDRLAGNLDFEFRTKIERPAKKPVGEDRDDKE